MNLLYISNEYPPETGYGGIGTYTKYIAEGMAMRGHSVSVVARSNGVTENTAHQNGVVIHRIVPIPYPLPAHRYAYPLRRICTSQFPHTLDRLAWGMAVSRKIRSLLGDGHRFDIIEAPECGAEGLFVSRSMCKKRIIRLHTPWEVIRRLDRVREPAGDRLLLPLLERHAAQNANAVSAPSVAIAERLRYCWRLPPVSIIPNPLPVHAFSPSQGQAWIYTGRIERRKGVHHLIAAYAKIVRHYSHVPALKLVGRAYGTEASGTDYGTVIRTMIAHSGIQDRVVWIENARLEDVALQLQDAAVAFFPSLWENFPYACLEAMSSGCAVVATMCGGFPEIINHGENGLLVDPGSDGALESAMRQLLENPSLISRLGQAARQRMKELVTIDRICSEMELFYQNSQE